MSKKKMRTNLKIKNVLKGVLLYAAATSLLGCSSGEKKQALRTDQGVLRYAMGSNLLYLDPALNWDAHTREILAQVHEGLVRLDAQNKIVPAFAERWEVSKDGKTYTFFLRKDIKFHNGKVATAKDFKATIERNANPKLASPTIADHLNDIVDLKERVAGKAKEVTGVQTEGDYIVKITLKQPNASFLSKLIVEAAAVMPADAPSEAIANIKDSIGIGPYKFSEFHPDQMIVLEAHEDYFEGKPKIKKQEILIIKDSQVVLNKFKAGELDFATPPELELPSLSQDPKYKDLLQTFDAATTYYLEFKPSIFEPFKDVRVRKAIAMAIDQKFIAEDILKEVVIPANSMLPKGFPAYRETASHLKFDPKEASRLLDEAGYKDRSKFPEFSIYLSAGSPTGPTVIENTVLQLKKNLGLRVTVQKLEWGTLLAKIQQGQIPIRFAGWGADYVDPSNFLSNLFSSTATQNYCGYSNPDFDRLCAQADVMLDEKGRMELYGKAEDILLQDAYIVPMFFTKKHELFQKGVTGYERNILAVLPLHKMEKH